MSLSRRCCDEDASNYMSSIKLPQSDHVDRDLSGPVVVVVCSIVVSSNCFSDDDHDGLQRGGTLCILDASSQLGDELCSFFIRFVDISENLLHTYNGQKCARTKLTDSTGGP